MATKFTTIPLNQRLGQWLQERQTLIVRLCTINNFTIKDLQTNTVNKEIDEFFQLLIDYVCSGHFEIYHRMIDHIEKTAHFDRSFAQESLSSIQASTDLAVFLNDKYEHQTIKDHDALLKDISALAETLAERFELEDLFIELIEQVGHASQVSA